MTDPSARRTPSRAAVVLVPRSRTTVLGVSRGPRSQVWGLPGGYIERGERPLQGASRELFEETGFKLDKSRKLGVFDTDGIETHAYLALQWTGRLRGSREGRAEWRTHLDLLDGPYGDTNREIWKVWRRIS